MTYSIVARDTDTGEMGVAIQSAVVGVGIHCPWAEAGVGAVVTQSLLRASHGPSGLALMRNGHSAQEALAAVLAADDWRDTRQIGMIDAQGGSDAFTGATCMRYAGQQVGDQYAVQANMMAHAGVPEAMARAFETTRGPLVLRLLAALRGAQAVGGDFRGQQSAALHIVSGTLPKNAWDGVVYNVRVDDYAAPVDEVARICELQRASHLLGNGFALAAQGDIDGAMQMYHAAAALAPNDPQFRFLFAVEIGTTYQRLDVVAAILRTYFKDEVWKDYFHRMADVRLRQQPDARKAVEALMVD